MKKYLLCFSIILFFLFNINFTVYPKGGSSKASSTSTSSSKASSASNSSTKPSSASTSSSKPSSASTSSSKASSTSISSGSFSPAAKPSNTPASSSISNSTTKPSNIAPTTSSKAAGNNIKSGNFSNANSSSIKNASTSTNSYKSGSFSNSKSNNTTSNSSNIKGTPIKTVKITSTPSIESTAKKDSLITSGMFKGGILKSSNSIPTKGMPVIISMDGNDIYVDCTDDGNYVCNYYTASPSENSSSWQGNVGYLASSPIKKSHAGTIIFGSLITVFFLRKIIKLSRPH